MTHSRFSHDAPGPNLGGWEMALVGGILQVAPLNDLRPHEPDERCWCRPTWDEGDFLVHNALDARERWERGEVMPC